MLQGKLNQLADMPRDACSFNVKDFSHFSEKAAAYLDSMISEMTTVAAAAGTKGNPNIKKIDEKQIAETSM
uniref:Uncharacterized protein n=1 Tax=Caenorhabditis tropicalis TaxID=1561998 RepID=A0A1I7U5T6_9PELO